MTKLYRTPLLLFLLFLSSCLAVKTNPSHSNSTLTYAVLSGKQGLEAINQCSRITPVVDTVFANTTIDYAKIMNALKRNVKVRDTLKRPLTDHLFQLICFKGPKYHGVYINVFPSVDTAVVLDYNPDWRNKAINWCDGGHWYWGIVYDLDKECFSDFEFSGP